MEFKCKDCGAVNKVEKKGVSFLDYFTNKDKSPEKPTLQDEYNFVMSMDVGDVIAGWGGGKLTKENYGIWRLDDSRINGGSQWFGEHVHFVELARYMWIVRDYFKEKFGVKWAADYRWNEPSGVRYYPITGIEESLRVPCEKVGFRGMKITEDECERIGFEG